MNLVITGGDASDGYKCVLKCNTTDVYQRVVQSGEFPKDHREQTVYTNREPAD